MVIHSVSSQEEDSFEESSDEEDPADVDELNALMAAPVVMTATVVPSCNGCVRRIFASKA